MGKDKADGSDIYRSVKEVSPGVFAAVVTIQVAGLRLNLLLKTHRLRL